MKALEQLTGEFASDTKPASAIDADNGNEGEFVDVVVDGRGVEGGEPNWLIFTADLIRPNMPSDSLLESVVITSDLR